MRKKPRRTKLSYDVLTLDDDQPNGQPPLNTQPTQQRHTHFEQRTDGGISTKQSYYNMPPVACSGTTTWSHDLSEPPLPHDTEYNVVENHGTHDMGDSLDDGSFRYMEPGYTEILKSSAEMPLKRKRNPGVCEVI